MTASRENRSRRFPELECFLADMVHFKADTMENRKKLLDMAEQLVENAVKQDRKYNGYLFETYKVDRLRSAIYHARNAVTTQEELETEKVLYAEDGEVKQQVEERRRDRARAVWNDSMPGWRRNPLYEMKEDSFMDRCREWGLRTPEQQDIMQKLYRAAVLDGADSNLQREILNLPANQMMTEDSSDRDGFEQRDYLRAVKEKIVGQGLDKMANYREFLNAADAWLSRYAERDAAAYQRRMADSPQDFERWYLYGEGMKKLPEEYLGSEGLENFIKKAKENGWTREGDEQLLMDFYTDCMTVTGGTAERGHAALAQLLQIDGSDVEQRRKALKIVDTIEDMGIGVNCIRHLFYAGTAVDEKLPVTGLDSLPIENHRKIAHSLEKAMRETEALEEEQYRERSERRRRQEQIIVQKPVPEGKGNAAESRKVLEERVRRERVRLARKLRESLVEQFQELNIKLAESGLNHGTSLQQQLMEKEHNRYVQMDPDVKTWTNQRASEYIVEVREKVDAAKALQTRMRELNTVNRSAQFRGMVNALQAVCSLNENSTPQQVQEAFMQLDVSSRAYTDKIKLNGEGKGIAGGKRVDLAKECMALTVGYRQLSKKAKMLDVTVGVNQQIERRSMDIADAYAEQQNEQRHKHIAWNDFKSIPGEGNIINNSRRSRSSGNDNNLNNQQHVNNTFGGKKN